MTQEAFGRLVIESTDSLYRVSKGILRNDSDCEEAVAEAIVVGFEHLHALREDAYAKTWLIRILIHECYKVLRRRSKMADIETEKIQDRQEGAAQTDEWQVQERSQLYEALLRLDMKYRTPVILYYLEGYSIKEIAGILGSTEGTVKSWLSRGRRNLRKIMEEDCL